MLEEINKTVSLIREKTTTIPYAGIILGTGLGNLVKEIKTETVIPYDSLHYFPVSTVKGHKGNLIFGELGGKKVVAMQGRFHFYEGYSFNKLSLPVRVLKNLGIELLILSNASGGVNPDFNIGDMMIVEDQINLMSGNPLIGPYNPGFGDRFPDMSEPYNSEIIQKVKTIALKNNISTKSGVLAAVTGPCFETPAEYRYIRTIGADAVGMSIIPEVITARQMKLKCFAISVISDLGIEGRIVEVTHADVMEAASKVEPKMTLLIRELLESS
ncbi:MAG: purine-nucleoside phosphorylase [Bacteroidales bacterium]|nr:purine-nucleoside phosphorylase [Bacteroidales bacterium]